MSDTTPDSADSTFETLAPADLDAAQAQREVDRLRVRIGELRDQYYEGNGSTVSDGDYDAMVRRLDAIEQRFPDLRTRTARPRPSAARRRRCSSRRSSTPSAC